MNSESNAPTPRTQSTKSPSYKRMHRAHQPVLVKGEAQEQDVQATEETMQPVAQVAVEEPPPSVAETPKAPRRRMPAFFTNIGAASKETAQADPNAARMARALRNKSTERASEATATTKKPAAAAKASSVPNRPPSRFKMRYLWGMMIYVLIAEYLGTFVTGYMQANHLDSLLFQVSTPLGPLKFLTSTLVFLALLVVILIVMARFDLIPRSLGAMAGSPPPRGSAAGSSKQAPSFETRALQPTMKQGVKGSDDDLYQEYRANQRYFQKRDRKR